MVLEKNSTEKEMHPHPNPTLAYFIWILCLIFNFYAYLTQFSAWDAAASKLVGTDAPSLGLGRLLLSYNISVILFQIPIALLLDKFGPRRMTSLFMLIGAIGVIVISFSTTPQAFWLGAFIMGVGGTITVVNTLKIVSNWFLPKKFMIMLAWTSLSLIFGAVVGQALTNVIAQTFEWPILMFNYGLFGILYAVIFFVFVRDTQPGFRYKIVPQPKHFALLKSVKNALKKGETYALALFCGLALSQWFAFYGVWHVNFYKIIYPQASKIANVINLTSMLGFAVGTLFFLYFSHFIKRRKMFMVIGTTMSLIFTTCTIYFPHIPFSIHVIFDFLSTAGAGSVFLGYAMIHEKNIPAITATVIGCIVVSLAIFRLAGEAFIIAILNSFKVPAATPSSYSIEQYQYALIVVPFALLLALICLVFVKETRGVQTYED